VEAIAFSIDQALWVWEVAHSAIKRHPLSQLFVEAAFMHQHYSAFAFSEDVGLRQRP